MIYIKDFENWNKEKQYINKFHDDLFFAKREIWWCAFGVNIGVEIEKSSYSNDYK